MLTLTIAGFVATLALSIRAQAVSTASGITICVNPSGSNGCFMTISAAIASATSGSTITVAGGFYQEALAIGGIAHGAKPCIRCV
jgi:pectin methylesterase-like acyl-CoA thioesterase